MEIEDAHHPLQGARKSGGLIGHGLSSGESKFEGDDLVGARVLCAGEFLEYPRRLMMAAEGDRCRVGRVGLESIRPVGVVEEGDLVALLVELIGGYEAGQAGAHNQHGLGGRRSHENRERSHTPRAISTR
jgi:hypothetical protein